jgi:hypothetical protein
VGLPVSGSTSRNLTVSTVCFIGSFEFGLSKVSTFFSSSQIEVFKINDGKEYIVLSGIAEGDTIVAAGAGLLKAGTKVVAAKSKKASEATPGEENKNQEDKK